MSLSEPLVTIRPADEVDEEGATEITGTPFNKMRILLYDDKVSVIRLEEPCMEFVFTHPLMRRAFGAYAGVTAVLDHSPAAL